jgi:Fic family protein
VLTADEDDPGTPDLREILNYVAMAEHGFARMAEGRPISPSLINELHALLMQDTPLQPEAGHPRTGQVVIGRQPGADPAGFAVHGARFVPSPPGSGLEADLRDLTAWIREDRSDRLDPIVASAMAHYQFETLHPYRDGNGRIGRYLIVLHLQVLGVLSEPTLTVSPWFEGRRTEYYDLLFGVSTRGDWDAYVGFFANGLEHAARSTRDEMVALVGVQEELKERLRASPLRAGSAHQLIDLAIANPSFTVRRVETHLNLSYGRANKLVGQLVDLGILDVVDPGAYKRRFYAPRVLQVLTQRGSS